MRLKIQMIPKTMYEKNVRSELTTTDWQQLSRLIRYQAHGTCSICEAENLDLRDMDAHEVWDYIIEKKNGEKVYIQRLKEIIPVCKKCHAAIHIGHTKALGKQTHTNCYERAVDHFMEVNHCGYSKFVEKERKAHKKWLKRSKHKWKLDINRDYINHLLEERVEV